MTWLGDSSGAREVPDGAGSPSRALVVALGAFAAMWAVAVATHYVYTAVAPTSLARTREISIVGFFFASLLCCVVALPWMIRVARPLVAMRQPSDWPGWMLVRVALVSALGSACLVRFLPHGSRAAIDTIVAAPKLVVPGLVLSAIAEEIFFREALPSAIAGYVHTINRRSLFQAAVYSLVVSQGLCALGHLTPSARLVHADGVLWRNVGWVVGSNFVFGSLMLLNWWAGTSAAERVILHTFANLAIVLAPTRVTDGMWRSALFCAVGLAVSGAMLLLTRRWPRRVAILTGTTQVTRRIGS